MDSPRQPGTSQSPRPFKPVQTILQQEMEEAEAELVRPAGGLLLSGMLAGITIGFSTLLIVTLVEISGNAASPLALQPLLAIAYSVGFTLVILGRMDLFTEYTTLAILPVLHRQAGYQQLARLWGLVYAGNLAGVAVISALLAAGISQLEIASSSTLGEVSRDLLRPSAAGIALSAILAGWLMGLLSWLVTAARETISQILFVVLTTGTIGLAHLHHSIGGAVEVLTAVFMGESTLPQFGRFLLWSTLGNAAGGIAFAAMIHHSALLTSSGRDTADDKKESDRRKKQI